jgi:hypothetical protein
MVEGAVFGGPTLPRGWVCCACFRKYGIGVYNNAKARECCKCHHKRCVGAGKRKWPDLQIAAPAETLAGGSGFLSGLMRLFGIKPPEPPKPEQDPWTKACDDVIAAFASAQLRAEHAGQSMKGPPMTEFAQDVKASLPRALQIFGDHPTNAPPCLCRHYSIIAASAEKVVRVTGKDYVQTVKSGQRILDSYLNSRS